jgi:hypothetical protein
MGVRPAGIVAGERRFSALARPKEQSYGLFPESFLYAAQQVRSFIKHLPAI